MARSRSLARVPLLGRVHAPAGAALNALLRLGIVLMSVDAMSTEATSLRRKRARPIRQQNV
jgi:hypothetical protein